MLFIEYDSILGLLVRFPIFSKPELFTEHFKRVGQIVTPDKFSEM